MVEFLRAHWPLIAVCLASAVSVANAITRHWSEHKGLIKWMLFVVEVLSVVTSAGATVGQGPLCKIKLPLQSVEPEGVPCAPEPQF